MSFTIILEEIKSCFEVEKLNPSGFPLIAISNPSTCTSMK